MELQDQFTFPTSSKPILNIVVPKRECIKARELGKLGYTSLHVWSESESHVYIGRRNPGLHIYQAMWGNPYRLLHYERSEAVNLYEDYVRRNSTLLSRIPSLNNKILGCYCRPNQLCHGDILIKLFREHHSMA